MVEITSDLRHTQQVDAKPEVVYAILADVTQWPHTFGPTLHAEPIETRGDQERIRIWAWANGRVRDWTSKRVLNPTGQTIDFGQEVSRSPVLRMSGRWEVKALGWLQSEVTLTHSFTTATAEADAEVRRAVNTNSVAELEALAVAAEDPLRDMCRTTFEDSVTIDAPAWKIFDFLWSADLWPERLGHVARVELNDRDGVQHLVMTTLGSDNSEHTTVSSRVCPEPGRRITYKQTDMPAVMRAHVGQWCIADDNGTTVVTSRHTVFVNPKEVAQHGGLDATLLALRAALGGNSLKTLNAAKVHCEHAAKVPA